MTIVSTLVLQSRTLWNYRISRFLTWYKKSTLSMCSRRNRINRWIYFLIRWMKQGKKVIMYHRTILWMGIRVKTVHCIFQKLPKLGKICLSGTTSVNNSLFHLRDTTSIIWFVKRSKGRWFRLSMFCMGWKYRKFSLLIL